MEKEKLIQKWLDNSLTAEEFEAFKQLEEYDDYVKITETAKHFKAPIFDSEKNYTKIQEKIHSKKQSASWKVLLKTAAVFALLIATYFGLVHTTETTIETDIAATKEIVLPDNSVVTLNAESAISYNENTWHKNRELELEGEAFFKVEKGSQFEVQTPAGTVRVLGTQFNVKSRDNYFEVQCFEGLVAVLVNENRTELPAGATLKLLNGEIVTGTTMDQNPTWISGWSSFKSTPYAEVLAELERQYNVTINTEAVELDKEKLFTGRFTHSNLDAALQSVTLPFNLQFSKSKNEVILQEIE